MRTWKMCASESVVMRGNLLRELGHMSSFENFTGMDTQGTSPLSHDLDVVCFRRIISIIII